MLYVRPEMKFEIESKTISIQYQKHFSGSNELRTISKQYYMFKLCAK